MYVPLALALLSRSALLPPRCALALSLPERVQRQKESRVLRYMDVHAHDCPELVQPTVETAERIQNLESCA